MYASRTVQSISVAFKPFSTTVIECQVTWIFYQKKAKSKQTNCHVGAQTNSGGTQSDAVTTVSTTSKQRYRSNITAEPRKGRLKRVNLQIFGDGD